MFWIPMADATRRYLCGVAIGGSRKWWADLQDTLATQWLRYRLSIILFSILTVYCFSHHITWLKVLTYTSSNLVKVSLFHFFCLLVVGCFFCIRHTAPLHSQQDHRFIFLHMIIVTWIKCRHAVNAINTDWHSKLTVVNWYKIITNRMASEAGCEHFATADCQPRPHRCTP